MLERPPNPPSAGLFGWFIDCVKMSDQTFVDIAGMDAFSYTLIFRVGFKIFCIFLPIGEFKL